jgi:hypothetical protein
MNVGRSISGKRGQGHSNVGPGFCGFSGSGQDEISVVADGVMGRWADGVILKRLTEEQSRNSFPIQAAEPF